MCYIHSNACSLCIYLSTVMSPQSWVTDVDVCGCVCIWLVGVPRSHVRVSAVNYTIVLRIPCVNVFFMLLKEGDLFITG